jgi:hypothetical protein
MQSVPVRTTPRGVAMRDVRLYDLGRLVGFLPRTEAAEEWIAENVQAEPHQRPGLIFSWVEARHAGDLANAMIGAGLDVGSQ